MSVIGGQASGGQEVPFMPGFRPFNSLWEGDDAPYPSEYSARWALRKMREELARANAVGMHRRRFMIHPERFAEVAERVALQEFSARAGNVDFD